MEGGQYREKDKIEDKNTVITLIYNLFPLKFINLGPQGPRQRELKAYQA